MAERFQYTLNQEDKAMEKRTQPSTVGQWLRYIGMALIAIWLIVWLLRMSGINV